MLFARLCGVVWLCMCVDVCVKAQSWHWESLLLTEEEPLIELRVAGYG